MMQNNAQSTVGIEFSTRALDFEKSLIKAQIWDTAGQDRFTTMSRAYYKDALGAALIYDISKRESFDNLKEKWIPQLREFGHANMRMILGELFYHVVIIARLRTTSTYSCRYWFVAVGNKLDLSAQRTTSLEEALSLANELNLDYIETSAMTGAGVEPMFRRLILSIAR